MNNTLSIKSYRQTINRCSVSMLVLFGLLTVLSTVSAFVFEFLGDKLSPLSYEIVESSVSIFIYFFSFTFPIVIFKSMSKNAVYYPLPASPVLPKHTFKICFAAVAIVFSSSLINSQIMSVITSVFGEIDMGIFETEINGIQTFILMFISTAVVPALVEEFLFRGVFLKNLLPYGKTVAVVVSSLYFALMHQNFFQFFYTFMAGLVFAYVFLRTGSIWCGVLIHFINNFLSVLTEVFAFYLNEDAAIKLQYLLYTVVVFAGVLSLILLIKSEKKAAANIKLKQGSVFGVTEDIRVFDSDTRLDGSSAIKNFFTPATIIVLVFSLVYASIIILAMLAPIAS